MQFSKLTGTKQHVPDSELQATRPYRIALVVKNRVNPAYLSAMKAGDDAAAQYGIVVEHFVPSTPDDLGQQDALLDAVLEGSFDALLVTPVDADAQAEVFRRFNAA